MKKGDDVPAGHLNLLIALYTVQTTGDEVTGETLLRAGIPAAKRSVPGASREFSEAGREVAQQFAVFTIRYRSGVDSATVLMHAGERWDIDFVDNINGANRKLEIAARKAR